MAKANVCKECGKKYDIKEIERVFGHAHWRHWHCSSQCYTKSLNTYKNEKKPSTEYFVRTMKGGFVSEEPLSGQLFDIVIRTKKGSINISIKEDMLKVTAEGRVIIHPETSNSVMIESSDNKEERK